MNAKAERLPYPLARLGDGRSRAMLFDSSKCIGCRQCVEGCKDWNELARGDPYRIGGSTWITIEPPVPEGASANWGRNSCMHCRFPLCAAVCPVEAISRYEEGPVVIDAASCIGCALCAHACPWRVIAIDRPGNKASKCTMCHERVAEGAVPFCVEVCPVGALEFGLQEDMDARAVAASGERRAVLYGRREAGGTQVLHVLTASPADHGNPAVAPQIFPRHGITAWMTVKALFSFAGGADGKWRALRNAVSKPWRLKYRYWNRPGGPD